MHRAARELEEALTQQGAPAAAEHVNFAGRRFARSCRLALGRTQAAFRVSGATYQPHHRSVRPLARGFLVPEAMALMVERRFPVGSACTKAAGANWWRRSGTAVIDITSARSPRRSVDLATHPLYE